ncbi:serine carboxypeptidase S28 [Nitzschia inconspicua]|uniref:Serine carboxypeptidase S28 n=1 Tax=Nitzschia inconspicua TaxID=303405 RepID=A0A9K3L4C2_9STRA|nr:serine carboxypeptidase S28 [Nitzschia inconspicua]
MSSNMTSYQNGGQHKYTPVAVGEDSDVVVLDQETSLLSSNKRKFLLGGALSLWVACVALARNLSSNSPSMDVLLPDGRHDYRSDTFIPQWMDQVVDHFDDSNDATFKQKYFTYDKFWKGPGHPIIFVLGGEDPMDDLITPFAYYYMAQKFGAMSFGVEHRYFGDSFPIVNYTNQDLVQLMTPEQAVEDFANAAQFIRKKLGCSMDKSSKHYCPVITVAGSYPGFLSAMLRLTHPEVVDIAYATSAPLWLYSHGVDHKTYYDYVTMVADAAVPGCAAAVKEIVMEFHDWAVSPDATMFEKANEIKICEGGIPEYITDSNSLELWWTEVNEIVTAHFAEADMGYYPPGPDAELERACRIFLKEGDSMQEKIGNMLTMRKEWQSTGCFDMHSELPVGKKATISASDWSGMGDGIKAFMWELLSCQLLPQLTQSDESMFYPREWTLEWTANHCKERFDMDVDPDRLRNYFGFEDLTGVDHLLFINNIADGWSAASVTVPPPNSGIEVINVINGAHCSDFRGPGKNFDTPEMQAAHKKILEIIAKWLKEIKDERKQSK